MEYIHTQQIMLSCIVLWTTSNIVRCHEQIFGLKAVTIYSGDRNNSVVNMIGIKEADDVVSEIRMRVEFNKRRKGIYEITNRV